MGDKNKKTAMGDVNSMDLIGPLPTTSQGNKYILVLTDHFSKWVEAYPAKDQTAITCAEILCKEFVS